MTGIKHLIQCHCTLPQYRNRKDPVFHQFLVFSILDEEDIIVPKFVECNNCGAIHKILEIGKSEIAVGREDLSSIMSKEDLKFNLPQSIVSVLETYTCDLPTWEEVQFYFDNQMWGAEIILKKEEISGMMQGKLLRLLSPTQIKIETFSRDEYLK